jgi:hypothetical protein
MLRKYLLHALHDWFIPVFDPTSNSVLTYHTGTIFSLIFFRTMQEPSIYYIIRRKAKEVATVLQKSQQKTTNRKKEKACTTTLKGGRLAK